MGNGIRVVGRGRGGMGRMLNWFIRILIYDMIVTGIADILGVSRMVALFIFFGILIAIGAVGYIIKQRVSPGVDE